MDNGERVERTVFFIIFSIANNGLMVVVNLLWGDRLAAGGFARRL